jgi:hypothetical protein
MLTKGRPVMWEKEKEKVIFEKEKDEHEEKKRAPS